MSLRVIHSGDGAPQFNWTEAHMRKLALLMRAHLVRRTFDLGIGVDGKQFKPYGTRPITIAFNSETGRRLKPKGGKPAYGSEKKADGTQTMGPAFIFRAKGRTGDTGRKTRGVIVGRHYEGGYAEYKASSRLGLVNANGATGVMVDLTLSGQLSRSIRVISTTQTQAVIGMTGDARNYGAFVDGKRPFLGFSEEDFAEGQRIINELVSAPARKAGGSRGSL